MYKLIKIEIVEKIEKTLLTVPLPLQQTQHFIPILEHLRNAQVVQPKKEEDDNSN